jgi:hypothetical protein
LPDQCLKPEVDDLGFLTLSRGRKGGVEELIIEIQRRPHADKYDRRVCIRQGASSAALGMGAPRATAPSSALVS